MAPEGGHLLLTDGAFSNEPFRIARGDRVAQLLVPRVERAAFTAVPSVDDTVRGGGGFGSTGR